MIKSFYLSHRWDPNRYYHSRTEWTWEQWQGRGIPHSTEVQNLSLTIISRITLRGFLLLCRNVVVILYDSNQVGCPKYTYIYIFFKYIYIYIYIYIYYKNAENNIKQVLAATPYKAPTIRPHASHHENCPS